MESDNSQGIIFVILTPATYVLIYLFRILSRAALCGCLFDGRHRGPAYGVGMQAPALLKGRFNGFDWFSWRPAACFISSIGL